MKSLQTLIEAQQLWQAIHNNRARSAQEAAAVVVLDCRATLGDPAAGPAAWVSGHIPGAVHANLEGELAADPHSELGNTGGRHPLPARAELAAKCGEWGIGNHTQVVVYDDAGGAYAARAWWLLRWLGHAKVAVLNGGIGAWTALPNSTLVSDTDAAQKPTEFVATQPLTRIASLADVLEIVRQQKETRDGTASNTDPTLIDARAQERFDGKVEPIDPVAGHIPGAYCLPHSGNIGPDGRFLEPAQLAKRFRSIGPTDDLICYCGSGVTAAHNVLALRHAGLPEPRLYVGSWSEWSADPERPVA